VLADGCAAGESNFAGLGINQSGEHRLDLREAFLPEIVQAVRPAFAHEIGVALDAFDGVESERMLGRGVEVGFLHRAGKVLSYFVITKALTTAKSRWKSPGATRTLLPPLP